MFVVIFFVSLFNINAYSALMTTDLWLLYNGALSRWLFSTAGGQSNALMTH